MNIEIANRLVNLRKSNNLSQEALADKLGISRQAVSKWERAEASPDTDNLILLARLYGVSLDELLKTDDEIVVVPEKKEASKEIIRDEREKQPSSIQALTAIISILIVITYLLIGCIFNAWHPGWLLFLLIPIWHSLAEAITRHNAKHFAYPVLATLLFFILGFFFNMWHPGWVLFITVPLYYTLISFLEAEHNRGNEAKGEDNNYEQ